MAESTPLASWIVEFDASGAHAIDGALESVRDQLGHVDQAAKTSAAAAASEMAGAASRISRSFADIKVPSFGEIKGPGFTPPGIVAPQAASSTFQQPQPAGQASAADSGPVEVKAFEGVSAVVAAAEKELAATRATTEGVAAALDLARERAAGFEHLADADVRRPYEDLHKSLVQIDHDFARGATSAEAAQRAIRNVVQASTDQLRAQSEAAAEASKRANALIASQTAAATEAAKRHADGVRAVGLAFAAVSGTTLAWVRAGLQGTVEGERLSFTFQQISRQVSGVFLPAINAVTRALEHVLNWFRGLSGEQQGLIGKMTLLTVGLTGTSFAFLKLKANVQALSPALMSAGQAMATAFAANPVLGVIAAIGVLLTTTEEGRAALGSIFESAKPAVEALVKTLATVAAGLAPAINLVAGLMQIFAESPVGAFTIQVGALTAVFFVLGNVIVAALTRGAAAIAAATVGMTAMARSTVMTTGAVGVLGGALKLLVAANPILLAAAAIAGLLAAVSGSSNAGEGAMPHQEVTQSGGGSESLEATWDRLQSAASKSDPAMQQRQEQIDLLRQIRDRSTGNIPGVQFNMPALIQ